MSPLRRTSVWNPLQRATLEAMGLPVDYAVYYAVGETAGELPDDPFVTALLRAAGRTPEAPDALRLVKSWPSPPMLRADPQAKRALWPQLRALRRSSV